MSKLLLLEDDLALVDGLKYSLTKNGYELDVVHCIHDAIEYMKMNQPDLLILDVSLPDGSGFGVCEFVRQSGNEVPIIFLTAADEEVNIIRGLDSGGDDYITKPFKLGELCSRINALLRRSHSTNNEQNQSLLKSAEITIDLMASRALLRGEPLELTAAEYRLLCILIRNKNQIVTRRLIFDSMWDGNGDFVDDNTLSVYVRRLREKIEKDPSNPLYLKTARGFGYIWEEKQ